MVLPIVRKVRRDGGDWVRGLILVVVSGLDVGM